MATMVYMEALSPTMEEGRLVKWLKQEGDAVKVGDALAEVETDKAVMELTARADGVLRQVSVAAGETVPVGHVVAAILAPGEGVGEGPAAARPPTVTVGNEKWETANVAAAPAAARAPAAGAPVPVGVAAAGRRPSLPHRRRRPRLLSPFPFPVSRLPSVLTKTSR